MKKYLFINVVALIMIGCGGDSKNHSSSSSQQASSINNSSNVNSSDITGSSNSSSNSSSLITSSSTSSSSSIVSQWELVWSDEFTGTTIDVDKWSFERNCTGGGNNELQCYTDRVENANVSDGKLRIIARKETFQGQAKGDDDASYDVNDVSVEREYTSARLRTKNKGDWKYGRVEINAKLPQGQGVWPAIWMLPTEWKYGGWPRSGEIDIMEAINSNTGSHGNKTYGTLHYGDSWPNNKNTGTSISSTTNIWDEFHTYAIEWEDGEIRWYVDSEHFATQTKDGWFNYYWAGQVEGFKVGTGAAPFDQLFHLILNVAVGGQWPGNPNDATQFPQQMDVDYVRVYHCKLDTVTGKGCASNINTAITPLAGEPKPIQKTFSLFNNGASTLSFTVAGNSVTNTLIPAFYDNNTGNVQSNPALASGENILWDLMISGAPGNAFLTSDPMASSTVVDPGFNLVKMETNGELKFDMYIESIDSTTKLAVKLDSGWPNASYREITNPEVGVWTSVSVPFEKLLPNNIQAGQVDMEKVTNPFVIEPSNGAAHIKLNNIRIHCILDCNVKPVSKASSSILSDSFDVYVNGVDPVWDYGIGEYDPNGHVTATEVDAVELERGKVIDVSFDTTANNGLAFVQATGTKNTSAFATAGYLSFDIKVLDYGTNTGGLVIKADCVNPCSSGDINIGKPGDGVWETVTVPVSQMVTGGLNLTKVNTPFIIMPKWDDQKGVHLQLDNIKWVKP